MAGLNVGDIVQITMVQDLFSQVLLNVFHYQVIVASDEPTYVAAAQQVADSFDSGVTSPGLKILDCQSEVLTWVKTRAQRVWPTRDIYVESAVNLPGTTEGNCLTPNVAATITKRGPLANRHNLGSTHIGGITSTDMFAGDLTAPMLVKMAAAAARFKLVYGPAVGATELRMVIYRKASPALSTGIEATAVQTTVRVMRRRTKGIGI